MNTRPQVTPPTTYAPRRDPIFGKYWLPANNWLRMIYAALLRLDCLRDCLGEHVTGDSVLLTETAQTLRAADSLAVETYIRNVGRREAKVYEAGAFLFYLAGNTGKKLPKAGLLAVTAKASGNEYETVTFTSSWVYDAGNGWTTLTTAIPTVTLTVGDILRVGADLNERAILSFPGVNQVRIGGEVTGGQVQLVKLKETATLTATTTRRCLCGDAPAYYASEPVGSFLL